MVRAELREVEAPGTGKTMTRRLPTPTWRKVKPNDRLYVRESHWRYGFWAHAFHETKERMAWSFKPVSVGADSILFEAPTGWQRRRRAADLDGWWTRPAIHHPRALSRLTLVVTAVKTEKLGLITEEDAKAEGAEKMVMDEDGKFYLDEDDGDYYCGFMGIWTHLHGLDSWIACPDVVALTFTVHRTNIDQLGKAA